MSKDLGTEPRNQAVRGITRARCHDNENSGEGLPHMRDEREIRLAAGRSVGVMQRSAVVEKGVVGGDV